MWEGEQADPMLPLSLQVVGLKAKVFPLDVVRFRVRFKFDRFAFGVFNDAVEFQDRCGLANVLEFEAVGRSWTTAGFTEYENLAAGYQLHKVGEAPGHPAQDGGEKDGELPIKE